MSIEAVIDHLLVAEGWPKYTNRRNDLGGPTKGGITLATLAGWRGRPTTAADVEALEEAEVRAIYRSLYVDEPGFGEIADELLREQVVDCGVLHGTGRAAAWLQEVANALGAGLRVDGRVGPQTQASVNALPPGRLGVLLAARRCRFLGEIVTANYKARRARQTGRDQAENDLGWLRRATSYLDREARRDEGLPVLWARFTRWEVERPPGGRAAVRVMGLPEGWREEAPGVVVNVSGGPVQ